MNHIVNHCAPDKASELVQRAKEALTRRDLLRARLAVIEEVRPDERSEEHQQQYLAALAQWAGAAREYRWALRDITNWVCQRMDRGMSLEEMGLAGMGLQENSHREHSAAWWLHQEFLEVCRQTQTQRRRRVMHEFNGRLLQTLPAWLEQREAKQWDASSI